MSQDWSRAEVTLIVDSYFQMLRLELQSRKYNKTQFREALLPRLEGRSNASVENKHQNISAVLAEVNVPYIKGYKPLFNYQELLKDEVIAFLHGYEEELKPLFESFVDRAIPEAPFSKADFDACLDDAPKRSELKERRLNFKAKKSDYLEREQNNRTLGFEGESFVIEYEKWRLHKAGRIDLLDKIKWVSKEDGDGAGYDIRSKNEDGSDRFIEVKTTKLTKETPIYLTINEVSFAARHSANFYLYRVFDFGSKTKLFIKQGDYADFCHLIAETYKGVF
ncbi:MAG: DUF3883 domain-containing protein [Bacteroidetes bacterium]|nr:DUF3883 domain-containing protein [Bacteroidota bacterium]